MNEWMNDWLGVELGRSLLLALDLTTLLSNLRLALMAEDIDKYILFGIANTYGPLFFKGGSQ